MMEVILIEKIDRLGGLGDRVNVRSGYARNFLLPQGKAKIATAENVAEIEARRVELEKDATAVQTAAEARREQLSKLEISITAKAGSEGKLFGSVGNTDIASAITEAGVALEKREVRLPDGPIHHAGEYDITLHLHADVDAVVKITIIAEED
jgi:large subunit ribosomal protein L9